MKNRTALRWVIICVLFPFPLLAQVSEALQNLEGTWYQESRNTICYTSWQRIHDQTMENRTISIICGDTLLKSQALLQFTDTAATLTVRDNGPAQQYRLTHSDNESLVWENENPNGSPQKLEWIFSSGGYATFISDGAEIIFRKRSRQPFQLKFRAMAGINANQYADPSGANRQLANASIASVEDETHKLPGGEVALSAGLLFPSTRFYLNFELGMAYRQVRAMASYYDFKSAVWVKRDGRYQNYNYYFAIVPEVFLGRRRDFSISAGFYTDFFQQRYFNGNATLQNADAPNTLHANLDKDIDSERGLIFGMNYRVAAREHLRPQLYLRYTHGFTNTQVRAISFGLGIEFEKL